MQNKCLVLGANHMHNSVVCLLRQTPMRMGMFQKLFPAR